VGPRSPEEVSASAEGQSVRGALGLHGDHVRNLALAVAVTRHHDEVVQSVRLEAEHAMVDAPVQRDALPDLVHLA